jgi:hypothetical protein
VSAYAEILAVLQSDAPIARDDVRRWIDSGDLLTWSALYELLERDAARIHPPLADEGIELARRYLLRCLEENPAPGDFLHGGYEAAWELAAVLKRWRQRGGRAMDAIRKVAVDLEKLYRRGDDAMRNRVLCGVMEHAFEDPAMRSHFSNWDRDIALREAFKLAIEWGATHEQP